MFRCSTSPRLCCESLEAREVPAVVVDGTFDGVNPPVPNGGSVNIQEVALAATDSVVNQAFTALEVTTKSATASDNITLNGGGTLTIDSTDGIYVRFTSGGTTFFHNRGTTLQINGVSAVNVNLQLGGDDSITDNSTLTATLNGGTGNDTIMIGGGSFNPLLLQFLQQPGGFNPLLLMAFGGMGGAKTIQGGAGNDNITGPTFGFFTQLDGGDGNDTIIGGLGPDIITGGNGFDILFGLGGGDFYIAFDFGPDFILNQPGDNVFPDMFDSFAGI